MKIDYSLITRRTFLNTLLGGWIAAFVMGSLYALYRFAFPTLGKEPDFVILNARDFLAIPPNSTKPFAWGGKLGLFFKRADNHMVALKGICSHMECNIVYKPESRRFYCPCHKGWFDEDGRNVEGPPPKPLEFFDYRIENDKLIVHRKGIKVELPKA
ncbi:MAG: Cytochrome b6-f complex iron-sulfur subunit [Syntrophorhabdaceae bacterium PtaU1.Bin034]|jgi:Rieske Fe-S protein|nr:MAG: Cytochrome b6-f complex iron-sulfur subunit [Syntrophorhabdaceae bacterium PtaU1.Bin034]